jgi:hypothetical protein
MQAQMQYEAALMQCFPAQIEQPVSPLLQPPVDILFMLDNSTSMTPKQQQIALAIPQFMTQIDGIASTYHVGVVTSDCGTLPPGLASYPGVNDPRCGTQNGDDGLLQNLPCTSRVNGSGPGGSTQVLPSQEFINACTGTMTQTALCPDPSYVPNGTDRWIAKSGGVNNIKTGNDSMAPIKAFQCIGLVGDTGCGVENQLESTKRALDGHLAENSGFLEDGSVLSIVWITDEDDCSLLPASRANMDTNPTAMDCSTTSNPPDLAFDCYNLDYRCIAKDVSCTGGATNGAMYTTGKKTGCTERSDTWLNPELLYTRFFGGLRDAQHLVFGGIWSPSLIDFANGVTTPYGDGQLDVESESPPDNGTSLLNRGPMQEAACFNSTAGLTTDPNGYRGQAQIRLETFKNTWDPSIWSEVSICDPTNYTTVLNGIAAKIAQKTLPCLGGTPLDDSAGNPECLVGYVDANQPDALPDTFMPTCSSTCCNAWAASKDPIGPFGPMNSIAKDPAIVTACTAEPQDCYCAVASTQGNCPGSVLAGLWQAGNMAPPAGKTVNFRCAGVRAASAPTN